MLFLFISFFASTFSPEDFQAGGPYSCVVGTRRYVFQGVDPETARFVGHEEANFSHINTFLGTTVVSVDIAGPSYIEGVPHIVGDWTLLSIPRSVFKNIFFEWFPTCYNEQDRKPILWLAVQKAFDCLEPGGELVIDLQPYMRTFSSDWAEALKLLSLQEILSLKGKIPKDLKDREVGLVSHLLQEHYDPFSIIFSLAEQKDIADLLLSISEPEVVCSSNPTDRKTNLNAVRQAIEILISIFNIPEEEQRDFVGELNNAVLEKQLRLIPAGTVSSQFKFYYVIFKWIYGMLSRGPGMIAALRRIGFDVADDAIQYYSLNPYNQRKRAWIIRARKPLTLDQ